MAVALYLCCLLIVGYGAAIWLTPKQAKLLRFGLSACLGPGVMGMILIALSMLGFTPTRTSIATLTILAAISIVAAAWRKKTDAPPKFPARSRLSSVQRWWLMFCALLIAFAIGMTAWNAFIFPTYEWDAFSIWQLKAKVLYLQPMVPRPAYFSDVTLSYSHLRYPLLVPMISAGVHAMTGDYQDESGQAAFLLMFIGLGATVFAAVRERRDAIAAATTTALLLTIPLAMRYAAAGTAEMALDAFYGCSLICILNYQRDETRNWLILAALFSGFMTWTKNEGTAMAAINLSIIAALIPKPFSSRKLFGDFAFLAIVAAMFIPWLIWSHGLPRTDEDYAGHFSIGRIVSHFSDIPLILKTMGLEFMRFRDFSGFWIVLILLAITNPQQFRARPVWTLWLALLLHAAAYVLVYMITPLNLVNLMQDSLDRLVLHFTPAAALLIGLHWPGRDPNSPAAHAILSDQLQKNQMQN
jgi:hypothetical protein